MERLLLAHSRKLRAILDAADRRIDEGKGLSHETFWQQVESASRVREVNATGKKRRAKRSGCARSSAGRTEHDRMRAQTRQAQRRSRPAQPDLRSYVPAIDARVDEIG